MKLRVVLVAFVLLNCFLSWGQSVYTEDFGTNTTVVLPYVFGTNASGTASKNTNFTSPSWTQSNASANFAGVTAATGCMSATIASIGGTNVMTCTFNVASGYVLNPTSIDYQYRISSTGAQKLDVNIAGTTGATANIAQLTTTRSGAFEPLVNSSFTTTTALEGTITLVITLSSTTGANSTARIDNVTLNGTVTPTGFTVTFNNNGGTGTMSNQTASTATNLSSNTFTRTGYTFTGWNTAANGSGTSYTNGASFSFIANTTLFAQWNPNFNITFANLQFPGTGSIPEGGTFEVFGRVYAAGLTNLGSPGLGITAEFGYSTSDTNPNTWTNWQAGTFNVDDFNNDEYKSTFSGLAMGTYYYATRFRYGTEPWVYGGFNTNSPTAGGNWNGTANYSGVLTVSSNVVDFANLELPYTGTITEGADFNAFAKVYKLGFTPPGGSSA
ncbi:MAG: InlB B-repeat-containing protein, partial [Flavobacterium sp.]|nr:InlB B-repeat-containing protein [Flavobacterium sp.]